MDYVKSVPKPDFSVTVQPPVLCPVVSPVHYFSKCAKVVAKERLSPLSKAKRKINSVKGAFIVGHCVFAPNVPNVHNVAHAQLMGSRLQNFWQTWSLLGANPRVVSILTDGYILLFKLRPPLVRDPLIVGMQIPSETSI